MSREDSYESSEGVAAPQSQAGTMIIPKGCRSSVREGTTPLWYLVRNEDLTWG